MGLYKTTEEEQKKVSKIALIMKSEGLDSDFVSDVTILANKYQGALGLLELWEKAGQDERTELVQALEKELIDFKTMPKKPTYLPLR